MSNLLRILGCAALLGPAALTGCSGGTTPAPSPEDPVSTATETPVSVAATLEGRAPALNHLRITACPSGEGDLEAAGAVRNRGKGVADYVVTVTWLAEDGAALERVETTVEDVRPARGARWTAQVTLDEPATSCTTTLARGTLP